MRKDVWMNDGDIVYVPAGSVLFGWLRGDGS